MFVDLNNVKITKFIENGQEPSKNCVVVLKEAIYFRKKICNKAMVHNYMLDILQVLNASI